MPQNSKVEWSLPTTQIKKVAHEPVQSTHTQTKFWNEPANPLDSSFSIDTFTSLLDFERVRLKIEHIFEKENKIFLCGSTTCVVVEGKWTEILFRKGMWIDVFECTCCSSESDIDDISMTSIDNEYRNETVINKEEINNEECNNGNYLIRNKDTTINNNEVVNMTELKNENNDLNNIESSNYNDLNNTDLIDITELSNNNESNSKNNESNLATKNESNLKNNESITDNFLNKFGISSDKHQNKFKKIVFVNDYQNLLTIESDIISVTTFIKAFRCKNEPYISRMVQEYNFNFKHPSLAIGTIIHIAIQNSLKNFTRKNLILNFKNVIAKSGVLLYSCNVDEKHALNECLKHLENIKKFSNFFDLKKETEIEKKISCSKLSLRGNVDVAIGDELVEIKTGKPNAFDIAQLILYTLLSGQTNAKLFYTATGKCESLQVTHPLVRDLLIKRAEVVLQEPVECSCSAICSGYARKDEYLTSILACLEKEQKEIKKIEAVVVSQNGKYVVIELTGSVNYSIDKHVTIYTKSDTFLVTGKIKEIKERRVHLELNELITINNFVIVWVSVEYCEIFYRTVRYAVLTSLDIVESFFSKKDTFFAESERDLSCCSIDTCNEEIKKDVVEYELEIPTPFKEDFFKLNEYQRNALFQCLNTKKYHLVHGMPGTGKTSVIALLIKILSYYKKSVLIVCYTNLSLKNICNRINERILYTNSQCVEDFGAKSVDALRAEFGRVKIVASTCFSFNHPVFIERKFDFLIIDEGSQIHLPLAFVPMTRTEKVVVFGDHLQLKPLAKTKLLQVSVFEALMCQNKYGCKNEFERVPKSVKINEKPKFIQRVSTLRIQYRMANEIMKISNAMFYFGKMLCGTKHSGFVQFIDTSMGVPEEVIKKCDVVLCYFNTQVDFIRKIGGVAETIDKFQGSEANKIVLCFDPIVDCEVMRSRERLNVGLTRAKLELICIGNRKKMESVQILKTLLELIDKK